jgi:quercetin dioxygenase-like cupin family protein
MVPMAALFLFSTSTPAQKYAAPFPRDGALKAGGNDYFAIWDTTFEKGKSTGMHELPLDQVYVFLTEGAVKFTKADGTWSIEQEKPGSVRYESKGTVEAEEGVSDKSSRAMVFQIENAIPPKRPIVPGIPDKFPRVGTVKLFETDRVVVWDYTWIKGMKTPVHLHYHVDAAVYFVPGKTQMTTDHGPQIQEWKFGQVLDGVAPLKAPHQEIQVEGEPRAIAISLK